MAERVEQLVGSRIDDVRVDGGLAYLEITHRGTDDEACTLLVRIPEIVWLYPAVSSVSSGAEHDQADT